jgi:hypothetical protein
MASSDEDRSRSRRPGAETRDGQAQVGYSMAKQSKGRVMLCVVYTMHKETTSVSFLVEPQNQGLQVSWLSLKTKVSGFPGLGLKIGSCGLVIWFTKSSRWFLSLDLKTKQAMVYRLHHKTNGRMKTA